MSRMRNRVKEQGGVKEQGSHAVSSHAVRMRNNILRDVLIAIGIAIALITGGCGYLTVAPKAVNAHVIAFDENSQNAGVIDCDANGCIVTPNWKAKYEQMEASFKNYIVADKNIKAEGKNFRVSYEVIEHNAGMKAAERGGP